MSLRSWLKEEVGTKRAPRAPAPRLTMRDAIAKGWKEGQLSPAAQVRCRAVGRVIGSILGWLIKFALIMIVTLIVGPKRMKNAAAYSLIRKVMR